MLRDVVAKVRGRALWAKAKRNWWAFFLVLWAIAALAPLAGNIFEQPPIRWTNVPFPTNNPVDPDVSGSLKTLVSRCNDTNRSIVTVVVRRLVNADTHAATSLTTGGGIVDPGCSDVVGGVGLPECVSAGRYWVEQYVRLSGTWRTFEIPLRTQEFAVLESNNPHCKEVGG